MTATNPIRVVQWGLGAMGQGMAKLITAKDGLELVGAIDVNPALDGKDIGEVLGIDPLGANVTTDPASILDSNKVDVVTIATTSWVRDQIADLRTIITAGINVVSIAEEMSCPEAQNPDMAKELDELAKKHSVSAVGVGVNPGFVLDHLVVALSSGSQEVTHIEARRVNDLAPYGQTVLHTQGVGTTPEEFKAGVADGSIVGHVGFPESIRLISDALGLGVDSIEQHIEPIIAKVARPARDRTVEPGQVAGCNHTAVGRRADEEVIRLIHPQQVAPEAEGQETGDFITITGVPDISMSTGPEIAGGKATAGICVNTIPRIVAATPGLRRLRRALAVCPHGTVGLRASLSEVTMADISHTAPLADSPIPKGTWVEVRTIILQPSERAAAVPEDTAATPLVQWVSGFLDEEAHIGDEVTITSIIGRRHTGVLDCVNPSYSHSFGNTVPELLTIGTTHEPITFHGQEDQS